MLQVSRAFGVLALLFWFPRVPCFLLLLLLQLESFSSLYKFSFFSVLSLALFFRSGSHMPNCLTPPANWAEMCVEPRPPPCSLAEKALLPLP